MIYCYPQIDGKKTRCFFYENWDEVPMTAFVKWQAVAMELEPLENKFNEMSEQYREIAEKIALCKYSGNASELPALEKQIKKLQTQIKPLLNQKTELEIKGIACFCNVPETALMQMTMFDTREDEFIEVWDTDNTLNAYKARLQALAVQKLPNEAQSEFYFQTETDATIEQLQKQYKKFGFIGRLLLPKAWKVRRKLKQAMYGRYRIKDIWQQTTFVNKELQEIANVIISQIKNGDFSSLLYLIAMMVVEGQEDSKVLESVKNKEPYVEKYKEAFIELYRKREAIFSQSKQSLSVGTVIRLKNFFLSAWKI